MHIRDRVAQTTNSSGTGALELNGTIAGFKTFAGALPALPAASDKVFPVLVKDGDAWELFESYLITGSPASLFRGALIGSSAIDGSRINLSNAENKPVYLLETAEQFGPMGGRSQFAVTAGTAPDFTATFTAPIRTPKNGTRCTVMFHADSASADNTFAPDGNAAKPIKAGRPLRKIAVGRILASLLAVLEFSESDDAWIVLSALPAGITKTVSGTTYTLIEEDHDTTLVFTSATGCAVAVPQSTGQFAAPFSWNYIVDAAAGTVTFTPTTSTINSAASLSASAGQSGAVRASGGNYLATVLGGKQATVPTPLIGNTGANSAAAPNTQMVITCPRLQLEDAGGNSRVVSLSATVDITLSGISGLDTGAEANSKTYAIWAVDLTTPAVNAAAPAVAATDKITWNGHGLAANTPVQVAATALGLTAGTTYYVKAPGANDLQVALTPGGAAVNITADGNVNIFTVPGLLLSLSGTAPTMPSGCTFKALVGGVYNNAAGNFAKTTITEREFKFPDVELLDSVAATTAATWQDLNISAIVPSWVVRISGNIGRNDSGNNASHSIWVAESVNAENPQGWSAWNANSVTPINGFYGCGPFHDLAMRTPGHIGWTAGSTSAINRITWHRGSF